MPEIQRLLDNNKEWAERTADENPEFFSVLAKQQTPMYLWIGCSDSRVPANQIVDLLPGEVFVHRNVANMVIHTDFNCMSVLQYALDVLKVKHIIVCGHYGCGGVEAALNGATFGLIDNWLLHIKDIAKTKKEELRQLSHQEQVNRLCELNVLEQAQNVRETSVFKDAIKRGQDVKLHSFIYSLSNGRIKVLERD
ncbi:carbonate dehydratase [Glaciecola petra]|uniref:Carbonic anhydrase n=1 Tax=Glaciecola petra TaxID=3075602 RepID=A0ABU2ZR52_9ALTE|nr:carbonate dehydratase [Aestuariibacter sp. P117]MDT0595109.1 carbonate dehydratase [Aestuariibacter sp. P117]